MEDTAAPRASTVTTTARKPLVSLVTGANTGIGLETGSPCAAADQKHRDRPPTTTTRAAGCTAVVHYPAPTGDPAARDTATEEVLDSAAEQQGHLSSVVRRGGSPATSELYLVVSVDCTAAAPVEERQPSLAQAPQ